MPLAPLPIDADALFRAVTATGFKLLAYHLNLDTGEISARTVRPGEVAPLPEGPSVQPLPKLGGDLTPVKDAQPFGPPPVASAKKLFPDEDLPKKPAFGGDFWKREGGPKKDLFGEGGFKRENGTKRLAEIFGEPKKDPAQGKALFAEKPAAETKPATTTPAAPDDPRQPRIPVASENEQAEWMRAFARDFGDPQIREELLQALNGAKPLASFERVLRKYQRTAQQWERFFRKTALACGEAWLNSLGISWELMESE